MYKDSGELTVILITLWWLQDLGKDWHYVGKKHRILMGERLNLRKLNELKVTKQYHLEISNRFAALENFSDSEHINRIWENIKENVKTSIEIV